MIPHAPLRLFAALTLASTSWFAQAADLTVAYQTTVDPAKVAQVDGDYEKASKANIDWRKFDNGADVITAVASGDVQIGYLAPARWPLPPPANCRSKPSSSPPRLVPVKRWSPATASRRHKT